MPASLTTNAPLLGNAAPKLRSSCNCCGTAKVKCDRVQPECGRCASLSLTCVYGLSRQSGKPPRKRPATDVEASARCKRSAPHSDESRNHHTVFGFTQSQNTNDCGQLKFFNSATDMPSSTSSLPNALRMNEQNQFSSTFFT